MIREATIFALVGFAVLIVIVFVVDSAKTEVWVLALAGIYCGIRYGMLAGLIVWMLYRMIRFAVFGGANGKD